MAMLGDVLAAARQSAAGIERWLAAEHPQLHEQATIAAAGEGSSFGDLVLGAVSDFAQRASGEDWTNLTSRLRDSAEPGAICLMVMLMLEWRLAGASRWTPTSKKKTDDERF